MLLGSLLTVACPALLRAKLFTVSMRYYEKASRTREARRDPALELATAIPVARQVQAGRIDTVLVRSVEQHDVGPAITIQVTDPPHTPVAISTPVVVVQLELPVAQAQLDAVTSKLVASREIGDVAPVG